MNTTTALNIKQDIGQALYSFVQEKEKRSKSIYTVEVEDWEVVDEWVANLDFAQKFLFFQDSKDVNPLFINSNKYGVCILLTPTKWDDFDEVFKELSKFYSGTIVLLDNSYYASELANAGVWELGASGCISKEPIYT